VNQYPCVSADTEYTQQERSNRDLVMSFYENAFNRHDLAAASSYLDPGYTEHSPQFKDGPDGFAEFFSEFWRLYPRFRLEVKRVFIQGDMVAAHVRAHEGASPNGDAIVDIFRLADGRIAEHWAVTRPIPESAANPNSMF
jgi:predicted SnoaL-like aldol condensation-catalyzing enzyme